MTPLTLSMLRNAPNATAHVMIARFTVAFGQGVPGRVWGSWSNMHADYFGANQPELNEELLDLCLRDAPEGVLHADPRCGIKLESRR